jgi:hypothetical protein
MRARKERKGNLMASRLHRKLQALAVGALAISALAANPALAGGRVTAHCSVTPNPVTMALPYTVSGSGFTPGIVVNVYVKDKISTWIANGTLVYPLTGTPVGLVAANGTFSMLLNSFVFYPSDLGTKTVSVVNAYDKKQTTLAQCTFSVQ